MTFYEVDFTYKVEEYGTVELEADNHEQAEDFAREHIMEAYPEVTNVEINAIKEVRRNG